ncbi:MAG: hypothetical protein WCA57_14595 [Ilumatobacteraceae bacterium]
MEPVDSRPLGEALPPPPAHGAGAVASSVAPSVETKDAARRRAGAVAVPSVLPMLPWRVAGAIALSIAFGLIGWEIRGVVDDRPWSDPVMYWSIVAGIVAGACVLGWTWSSVENARRLVGPASGRELPDPRHAVATWIVPFAFVGVAVTVVAYLGDRVSLNADDTVSSAPLAVAVIALLLAIPMTYRPLHYLSGVVRQVGGHSAKLAQWMWVPVALAVVGVASIVALRVGGAVFESGEPGAVDTATQWAPLWVIGVVVIAPCVIVILLAWRAASSVEEAIVLAADRRRRSPLAVAAGAPAPVSRSASASRSKQTRGLRPSKVATRGPVRLIPGDDLLRLGIVTLLAGLALLTIVGAAVMFLFWREASDGLLLPSERERAWDSFSTLHAAARFVGLSLIALVTIWTFVAVVNVRMASGRRRNPFVAAAAWPIAAAGFWLLADRLVEDQPAGVVIAGFAAQAVLLYLPFLLLERAADAVEARRTPLRITYVFGVVLLVYVQALGGLSTIEETTDPTRLGRLAGFLALGAMIQLLSTLAVTEACRVIETATDREAASHNALVEQREAIAQRAGTNPPERVASSPSVVPAPSTVPTVSP